jgi:hypothetical protein
VVRSIRTTNEKTTSIVDSRRGDDDDDESSSASPSLRDPENVVDLPQQLYISKLPGGSLRLGPGQIAIVPIAFLPRFPSSSDDDDDLAEEDRAANMPSNNCDRRTDSYTDSTRTPSKRRPKMSTFQRADWDDFMDSIESMAASDSSPLYFLHQRRSNLPSSESPSLVNPISETATRYLVSATVMVETDRGGVNGPLEFRSIRQNSFGLPDAIYFDDPDTVSDVSSKKQGVRDSKPAYISDEDKRIQETLDLFRSVKEKERLAMRKLSSDRNKKLTGNEQQSARIRIKNGHGDTRDENDTKSYDIDDHFELEDSMDRAKSKIIPKDVWIMDRRLQPLYGSAYDGTSSRKSTMKDGVNVTNTTQQTTASEAFDCYDVYIRNPDPSSLLKVTEVLLSRPEYVGLHVLPDQVRRESSFAISSSAKQYINNWSNRSKSVFGDSDGSLPIPGDGEPHYIVTICATMTGPSSPAPLLPRRNTPSINDHDVPSPFGSPIQNIPNGDTYLTGLPDWIDAGNRSALGFLQIKTSQETLFVHLLRADKIVRKHITLCDEGPYWERRAKKDNADRNERTSTWPSSDSATIQEVNRSNQTKEIFVTHPARLNFSFGSTSMPELNQFIDLVNVSPDPISVMRLALVLEQLTDSHPSSRVGSHVEGNNFYEKIGIEFKILHVADVLSKPIGAGVTLKNAISLICSIDWEKFSQGIYHRLSLEIKGALILRGTSETDLSYVDWARAVEAGYRKESNFVFEVPLTIKVIKVKVGFLVEASSHGVPSFWSMKEYSDSLDIVSCSFFPSHQSFTMATLTEMEKERMGINYFTGVDHQFRVFGDMDVDAVLDKVAIVAGNPLDTAVGSLCDRFGAYVVERGPNDNIDLGYLKNMGLIHVRYRFPTAETREMEKELEAFVQSDAIYPTTCNLRVTTDPACGVHEIPFMVYSGQLALSKSHKSQSFILKESFNVAPDENRTLYHVISGLDDVMQWFRSTKAGFALRSTLTVSTGRSAKDDQYIILLSRYLYELAGKPYSRDYPKLKPVLLKVGGIEQGEVETVPLYITNYNPVPITIRITVGEVEGQSIAIGRYSSAADGNVNDFNGFVPSSMKSSDPRAHSGRFRWHPVNGLRQVLLSNSIAQRYFSQFAYQDDISISDLAVSKFPFLRRQYKLYSMRHLHRRSVPLRFTADGWNRCEKSTHPPLYGSFQKKAATSAQVGPVIISSDRKSFRRLNVCWDANGDHEGPKADGTDIVVPPGGVARFDVRLRAPSQGNLHKDITQFVATGLVLSTDHGEIIPILVEFKALQGRLELTPVPALLESDKGDIRVPLELFEKASAHESTILRIPPHSIRSFEDLSTGEIVSRHASDGRSGVSLFMKSSFLRDVHLREIESCNPLFTVDLKNSSLINKSDRFLGISIGSIRSTIACEPIHGLPKNNSQFPSFFRCALNWLKKKQTQLQLRERGDIVNATILKDNNSAADHFEQADFDKLLTTLRRALLISEWSDELYSGEYTGDIPLRKISSLSIKSGRRSIDGVVSPKVVDAVTEALESILSASKVGFLSSETTLRALVEYNATPDEIAPSKHGSNEFHESSHQISIAIGKTSVTSTLSVPKLLNIEKLSGMRDNVDHAQVVEFQPTFFGHVRSIKIPLRNPTGVPVRVRLGVARGKSKFDQTSDSHLPPPYVQSNQRNDDWPRVWASEQWWDRGGAFFLADFDGNVIRSPFNVSIKSGLGALISTMNPSVSSNIAFLNGCGTRCGIAPENDYKVPLPVSVAPVSPIGISAAAGRIVVGQGGYIFMEQSGHMLLVNDEKQLDGRNFSVDAGGSFVTGGYGPSAFAIPYAALDEIIIPPFGEAEIGPLLFRPPGRTQKLDCRSVVDSSNLESCESQVFKSSIFLENSLTGLEQVILQGKAMWEKVVFRSPISQEGFDDIELRHGLPTLVFPYCKKNSTLSLVKEVVISNEGDVAVTIKNGFFSPRVCNSVCMEESKSSRICDLRNFRVLECNESSGVEPFYLSPGQNHSIFIELRHMSLKERDFIMLNLEVSSLIDQSSGAYIQGTVITRRRNVLSLSIGYEKQDMFYKPGRLHTKYFREYGKLSEDYRDSNSYSREYIYATGESNFFTSFLWIISIFCVLATWLAFLGRRVVWFRSYSATYYSNLIGMGSSVIAGQNWRAVFRCLARVDPTASDLQSMGREQTRHMVLARLKMMGAMQPQCFSSTGVPRRERIGTAGASGRQVNTTAGYSNNKSTVNERIRMSDSIFGKFPSSTISGSGLVPVQLGWRSTATRGMIDASTLEASPITLRTVDLLRRRAQPIPARIQAVTSRTCLNGDDSSSSSDLGSSLGDLSDVEASPKSPRGISCINAETISYPPALVKEACDDEFDNVATEHQNLNNAGNSFTFERSKDEDHRVDVTNSNALPVSATSHEATEESPTSDSAVAIVDVRAGRAFLENEEVVEDKYQSQIRSSSTKPPKISTTKGNLSLGKQSSNPTINPAQTQPTMSSSLTKNDKDMETSSNKVNKAGSTKVVSTTSVRMEVKSPLDETVGGAGQGKRQREMGKSSNSKSGKNSARAMKQSSPLKTFTSSTSTSSRAPKIVVPSAAPEATTNQSISPKPMSSSPKFRPPPGLLPPPGFQSAASNDDSSCPIYVPNDKSPRAIGSSSTAAWKKQPTVAPTAKNSDRDDDPLTRATFRHVQQSATSDISYQSQQQQQQQRKEHNHVMQPTQQPADDPLLGYHNTVFMTPPAIPRVTSSTNSAMAYIRSENVEHRPHQVSPPISPQQLNHPMLPALGPIMPTLSLDLQDIATSVAPPPSTAPMMMDFDIMDFLDGILDEEGMNNSHNNSSQSDLGGSSNILQHHGTATAHHPSDPSPHGHNNHATNVLPYSPMNPWSMDTSEYNTSSRAAAYGISFDSNDRSNTNHQHPYSHLQHGMEPVAVLSTGALPLLTPSAIFAPDPSYNDDDDTNNDNGTNDGSGLYNSNVPSPRYYYQRR